MLSAICKLKLIGRGCTQTFRLKTNTSFELASSDLHVFMLNHLCPYKTKEHWRRYVPKFVHSGGAVFSSGAMAQPEGKTAMYQNLYMTAGPGSPAI